MQNKTAICTCSNYLQRNVYCYLSFVIYMYMNVIFSAPLTKTQQKQTKYLHETEEEDSSMRSEK